MRSQPHSAQEPTLLGRKTVQNLEEEAIIGNSTWASITHQIGKMQKSVQLKSMVTLVGNIFQNIITSWLQIHLETPVCVMYSFTSIVLLLSLLLVCQGYPRHLALVLQYAMHGFFLSSLCASNYVIPFQWVERSVDQFIGYSRIDISHP